MCIYINTEYWPKHSPTLSLFDYSDACILVKTTIIVENAAAQDQPNSDANKNRTFKNCASFHNPISRINKMLVDDVHDIDVVMPIYNLVQYNNNYSKASAILWQYCRFNRL